MPNFTLRKLTSEDKIFFPLMNLVIVLFTFEETFSPLSPSFYLKVPLPLLGSARTPPTPPHAYRVSASLFPPLFAVSLIRCSANFFGDDWELGTGYRLCCDGLTPFFLSPRPLENGQMRESYEKYCKARVGHEDHQRWSAWVGFQRRTIDPASFLTNISVT